MIPYPHTHLTMCMEEVSYFSSFTPITNMGASAEGAEMTTFLAPPVMWAVAFSLVVKIPVDSTTMAAPWAPHGMVEGSRLYREGGSGGGREERGEWGREGGREGGRGEKGKRKRGTKILNNMHKHSFLRKATTRNSK